MTNERKETQNKSNLSLDNIKKENNKESKEDYEEMEQETIASSNGGSTNSAGDSKGTEEEAGDIIPLHSRGDIIQFYNKVFIDHVKDFVLKFSTQDEVNKL